ncbi:Bacterial SH3 domain protein [Hoeflea phototrophica DFL-43]|uniref:Bacterial SH3 domain protein n=1 Tax=Hoeflea phototrophica (strain DSM 17068 / NCIMB 14078 / DFL-43) TaxID=411684 RepID=A9D7H8_HOEPD|nr:SH3 domain-containing protein [Hoeflea phototrophica]EDQ33081.1 Bacterial SH3 domain protein [Hoeflea phototrophica DFL-43]
MSNGHGSKKALVGACLFVFISGTAMAQNNSYGQQLQGQPLQGQPLQGQPLQGQPPQGQPLQGQQGNQQQAQQVQLRAVNAFNEAVDVYRVNPSTNQPEPIGQIAPGQSRDLTTATGASWIFGINRTPVMNYRIQPGAYQEITIAPQGQQRSPLILAQPPVAGGQALQGQQAPQVSSIPPGLATSTLTMDSCMAGALTDQAMREICAYLDVLKASNPLAYQLYEQQALARRQVNPQQGQGNKNFSNQNLNPAPPIQQQGNFPEAASWGGIVRSGPTMESQRLDSLSEGEPITLLQNTGVDMGGYPWFQIRYRDGRGGYQWGGIICGRSQLIPGTYETCR